MYLIGLPLALLCAWYLYKRASDAKATYGTPPGRMPVAVWTLVGFLLGLLGVLLYLFGSWRQRKRVMPLSNPVGEDPELTLFNKLHRRYGLVADEVLAEWRVVRARYDLDADEQAEVLENACRLRLLEGRSPEAAIRTAVEARS